MPDLSFSLAELGTRFGLVVHGDSEIHITGIGTLEAAQAGQLGFLANPRYRSALASTRASAVVLRESDVAGCPVACLVARDPYAAFARIAALFDTPEAAPSGIHPHSQIADSAEIDPQASIGPFCSIGARSRVEAGAVIGAGCHIGEDCVVGANTLLMPRVTLVTRVKLGQRVRIHSGAVIGADGFGLAMHENRWIKVPQLGGVIIGDDCEIGANTTIDRGAIEDTQLEEDVRLDNQIQIGHNVRIGAHTAIAGCVAIAGSTRIGRYCLIAGGAGIVGHIALCDRVTITAMSLVTHSINEPGTYSSGTPLQDNPGWRRNAARFKQLDTLARKMTRLAKDES